MYEVNQNCISEKSKILVKKKDAKYFTYVSLSKLIKMLEEKKECYTLSSEGMSEKILKVECIGIQDFYEIKTFSGSRIFTGKETEFFVDGEWITAKEILFHETIYEYDFLRSHFKETFITSLKDVKDYKGYRIFTDKNEGVIVNNLIVRFIE